MASSPAFVNDSYDPKTDPARKAKNTHDPGWKYGYWAELQNRDVVTCTLCSIVVRGGIKRLKQHLAGGYGDAKMCAKTTTAIRKEMREYLEMHKRRRPLNFEDDDGDVDVLEVVPQEGNNADEVEDRNKVSPSLGTAAKRRQSALPFKPKPKAASNAKSIVQLLRRTPEEVVEQRHSGKAQNTIEASCKTKEEKHYVDMQWALWFYEAGVPFNAATSRQFEIALEATAQYGLGYIPPTSYQFGDPLLEAAVKMTSNVRKDHERAWKHFGCTLMSDGWTDRRGHHLINFLVNIPEGTYFLESVDASGEVHDAEMLADLLEKRIEQIGKDNVVQVITDNGANYKAAGRLLMERIPTLFWSPCAAHCLDLMLEDIGNLKEFKKPIARAKRVTTLIYRHGRVLNAMREKTGGRDLVRPAATRFATSFLTLKSMYKHKEALKALVNSEVWVGNKLAKTKAGENVRDIVLSTQFWNSVEDCLRASAPLLIVLRVVDGDERPAMPEVQALMSHAKEIINKAFDIQSKKSLLKRIMDIIERRWLKQMDHPLYGTTLYLNPGKLHSLIKEDDDTTVGQLRGCFLDVLAKMVEDDETRNKIDAQARDYELLRGTAFSNKMAIQNLDSVSPIDWWGSYGGRAIELQRFARRIVSLCASSSGCERNWSTFEFIHTKKRNRLLHKRLNSIVFVSYNRKMKTRFQIRRENKGKNIDPLVISEFDWDNEWAGSLHVPSQGVRGSDLTWELVDEATGASEALLGRNFPRRAHMNSKRARNSAPTVDEDDFDSRNEEDQDPYDDLDVSDHDDSPDEANNGEENEEAANILDAFDDFD